MSGAEQSIDDQQFTPSGWTMHERWRAECGGTLCVFGARDSNGMHARLHPSSCELSRHDVRVPTVVANSRIQRDPVVQSITEITEECSGGLTPRLQHQCK